jgi:serine protease Do
MRDSGVEFLQTDAAVNQGNSGGPLLNLRGEIIGINSAIYSETGGWLGISFAIPSNVARRALESLLKSGRVIRGYLGIMMMNLTPDLAREFGAPDTRGALVTDVMPGSPADQAGLKSGDVIRRLDGRNIDDMSALRGRIADAEIGGKVEIEFVREGKEQKTAAKIGEAPDRLAAAEPPAPPDPDASADPQLERAQPENVLSGVQVGEVPGVMREAMQESSAGVLVTEITPGTAASASLRAGDIIQQINQTPVTSPEEFAAARNELPPNRRAVLHILRGRTPAIVLLTP